MSPEPILRIGEMPPLLSIRELRPIHESKRPVEQKRLRISADRERSPVVERKNRKVELICDISRGRSEEVKDRQQLNTLKRVHGFGRPARAQSAPCG
jgi:hypothetical protein